MQIAQSPNCVKQLDNVGPKKASRWLLRLIPKGRKKPHDFFIEEDTKRHLVNLIRFQCEMCGENLIPVVTMEDDKLPQDRYVMQWNRKAVGRDDLNSFLRFLLHGLALRTVDGQNIQVSSHILRHGFATELAGMDTPLEVIAELLHQRDKTVTKYYSRPTPTQVMNAQEMIFIDRIDLSAESIRSPEEVGRNVEGCRRKGGRSYGSVWRNLCGC